MRTSCDHRRKPSRPLSSANVALDLHSDDKKDNTGNRKEKILCSQENLLLGEYLFTLGTAEIAGMVRRKSLEDD